jgi:hypothetical protein
MGVGRGADQVIIEFTRPHNEFRWGELRIAGQLEQPKSGEIGESMKKHGSCAF